MKCITYLLLKLQALAGGPQFFEDYFKSHQGMSVSQYAVYFKKNRSKEFEWVRNIHESWFRHQNKIVLVSSVTQLILHENKLWILNGSSHELFLDAPEDGKRWDARGGLLKGRWHYLNKFQTPDGERYKRCYQAGLYYTNKPSEQLTLIFCKNKGLVFSRAYMDQGIQEFRLIP